MWTSQLFFRTIPKFSKSPYPLLMPITTHKRTLFKKSFHSNWINKSWKLINKRSKLKSYLLQRSFHLWKRVQWVLKYFLPWIWHQLLASHPTSASTWKTKKQNHSRNCSKWSSRHQFWLIHKVKYKFRLQNN